ncbi:5-hydroxytryptamine receptor 1D-like [Onthophagus taurus]|uniref:5-hydroxytryptamine receptor 1D-like n=1 Tax=Onthophagus taurus TaxID=166361 RepID=UPI0039BE6227
METTTEYSYELEYTTVNMDNVTANITTSQKTQLLLYDILIPTVGVLAILLNGSIVVSSGLIIKKGQQPRSTYLFLGNVAMTDLVTSFAVMFGQLYPKENRNHSICCFQIGLIVSSTLASVYSVGLIAIDRFLYIIHGLQYQQWVYPLRARILILITWIIGCVVGFLPSMGWSGDSNGGKRCWFVLVAPKDLIFFTVCVGIIPLLIVIILYSIILYHAIRKINQLKRAQIADHENKIDVNDKGLRIFRGRGNQSDTSDVEVDQPSASREEKSLFKKIFPKKPSANPVNNPSKWKAIKVVVFTTGSFVITWCPYFIVSMMYTLCSDQTDPYCKSLMVLLASPLAILGFCNGLINPIIYAWWHQGFRTFITNKMQAIRNNRKSVVSSKNTSSTSGNRKISNISSDAAKLTKLHHRTQSKENIIDTNKEEYGSDNKSFTKSDASTKQSDLSLNRRSTTPEGFSYTEESTESNVNTHL